LWPEEEKTRRKTECVKEFTGTENPAEKSFFKAGGISAIFGEKVERLR
jgi:hypothetical protein